MADDNPDDCLVAMEAWKRCPLGKEIRFVQDGSDLMDYLYHRGKFGQAHLAPRPGLILLDIKMPKKTGFDVLKEIRSDRAFRLLPIVVLTDSLSVQDMRHADDLGATLFLHKPVTLAGYQDVIKALRTFCQKIRDQTQ